MPLNKNMTANVYSDPASWLPLDGLAPGFDANKAPLSSALQGHRTVLSTLGGRGRRRLRRRPGLPEPDARRRRPGTGQ